MKPQLFERVQHFNLENTPPCPWDRLLELFDDKGAIARG